jgi:hypothetical protein
VTALKGTVTGSGTRIPAMADRLVFINNAAFPTGWVATKEESHVVTR